ncbi:MAG TPA: GSCFA domain-containing protein, partial [Xanthomonadales bacterium]|nr:GSCFA domain-containing protein [Xanthomonadales bacterium]
MLRSGRLTRRVLDIVLIETREPFPYAGLPPYQNWRSVVDALGGGGAIDPQGPVKFRLEPSARIASAGSCFAQRLAVRLRDLGLRYVVAESGGEPLSARYGNIYTSRQLVQLIERALGRFDPLERAWTSADGFIDPFRPGIANGAFASLDALEGDRCAHLAAVKNLFGSVDVFLFTLGLTEFWMDARDGAVFPAAPGRGRGVFDPERHVFGNLDVAAVASDLERFIAILGEINPSAKLILTVSPVPMAATMVPRHIVRVSLQSKSVLKVAAEEVAARHAHVDYFAAYDVVMQNLGGEPLFAGDARRPTDAVADRVVRFFVHDYFAEAIAPQALLLTPPAQTATANDLCDEDLLLERIAADERGGASRTPLMLAPVHRNGDVEQVAHPIPLYFVGDSNSLAFKDRVFAMPGSETLYIGRTLHTPGLGAFDLCDIEGRLNENVLMRLVGEHLIVADDKGGWRAYERVGDVPLDYVQESEGRTRLHPPLLFFCGMFDWLCFYEEIGGRDVALPAEIVAADMYPADEAGMVDFDSAATIAGRYLEPLERGLRLLRSYGLRNLCLHSVQPPLPDDELFGRYFFPSTLSSRYRSMRLMNYLLRGVCERTGVSFIDLWPLVTNSDGILDLRYSFDAVHLNLEAGLLTVKLLLETIEALETDELRNAEPPAEHEDEELANMPDDIANFA